MKAIIFTTIVALTAVISFAYLTTSRSFQTQTYTKELCRAKAMASYESAWDNCCAKSGQGVSCKAKLSCEPSWNTYSSQMSSCLN